MTHYTDLELPADNTAATRIEWAGERYADLCEGLMTPDVGWFVWNVIVGWTDLGATEDEKTAYNAMGQNFADLLRANE
jgi:hypothetical protein